MKLDAADNSGHNGIALNQIVYHGQRASLMPASRDIWTIVEIPLAHARGYRQSKTQMTLVSLPHTRLEGVMRGWLCV